MDSNKYRKKGPKVRATACKNNNDTDDDLKSLREIKEILAKKDIFLSRVSIGKISKIAIYKVLSRAIRSIIPSTATTSTTEIQKICDRIIENPETRIAFADVLLKANLKLLEKKR